MNKQDIQIQSCRPDDIQAVLAFWRHAQAIARPTDHESALQKRLERDPELFVLAWDGSRIVGTLMGAWDGWRANMYRLIVDPAYRRKGIARKMVQAVESALGKMGVERITSLVFIGETGAEDFWKSVNYDFDPKLKRFAKNLKRSAG